MRQRCLAGDRTGALRQYERCVIALARKLGVGPTRQTELLAEQIKGGHLETVRLPDRLVGRPEIQSYSAVELLDQPNVIQASLDHIHYQLEMRFMPVHITANGKPSSGSQYPI